MAYAEVKQGKGYVWHVVLPSGRTAGTHYSERLAKNQAFSINRAKAERTARAKRGR